MLTSLSSRQRHAILIGSFLVFLLTISYYQYATASSKHRPSPYLTPEDQIKQDDLFLAPLSESAPVATTSPGQIMTSNINIKQQEQPCDKSDIPWLASDRQYWDGWKTKSFFLKPDGNFSLDNVYVEQNNGLCIVVLLGPVPAASKIKVVSHYAPPDIITMTAIGNHYSIPITLQQYPKQSNAYYANVFFRHSDSYVLKSTTEYRSHFWETPIQHQYQPFSFDSGNMAVVTTSSEPAAADLLPSCDAQQPSLSGSWRNDTNVYQFIPDHCEMRLTRQDGLRCLRQKTIHVWADANMRRNLKALASPNWCDMTIDPDAKCVCNDDNEDPDNLLYPWAADHNTPLVLGDNSIHYNSINTITLQDWRPEIKRRVDDHLPLADVVIVGVGNDDIALNRMKPHQFASSFSDFLQHLLQTAYPHAHQTIIVRTPQFFGTGNHYDTAWNAGRSRAFANVIRELVDPQQHARVKLWDTHQFGLEYNTCRYQGTTYTKRNVIDIENNSLFGILCSDLS